jgi:hypothetical protein
VRFNLAGHTRIRFPQCRHFARTFLCLGFVLMPRFRRANHTFCFEQPRRRATSEPERSECKSRTASSESTTPIYGIRERLTRAWPEPHPIEVVIHRRRHATWGVPPGACLRMGRQIACSWSEGEALLRVNVRSSSRKSVDSSTCYVR